MHHEYRWRLLWTALLKRARGFSRCFHLTRVFRAKRSLSTPFGPQIPLQVFTFAQIYLHFRDRNRRPTPQVDRAGKPSSSARTHRLATTAQVHISTVEAENPTSIETLPTEAVESPTHVFDISLRRAFLFYLARLFPNCGSLPESTGWKRMENLWMICWAPTTARVFGSLQVTGR